MDKFSWIKHLVTADRQMEDAGIVEFSMVDDPALQLEDASVDYLQDLKLEFLKVISAFNQLSSSTIGPIRVYSIAKTKADFMLFRNGTKLIFSLQNGGGIAVSHHMGSTGDEELSNHCLKPEMIAFGHMRWVYQGHIVQTDYLIRFYMTQFVRASAEVKAVAPSYNEERP